MSALLLLLAALALLAQTSSRPPPFVYFLYLLDLAASLVIGVIAWTTLVWMLHAWRVPEALAETGRRDDDRPPSHSISLIVPARHEEAVLETTLTRLIASDHPAFSVLVVVGDDDPGTRQVARRLAARHPSLIKVVVDSSSPKNKPKALNAALPYCSGSVTGVFDAEDDVHPALLRRVDQCFQRTGADIVQAGVQLMNFRTSWLAVHNVLEYYFWFRSRLHRHARQRFVPLGGNTVFIRTAVLAAVGGWDPECLAEDCELGVRLSTLGARTTVFYDPELVTREECPPTLRAFIRQRTRWNQGYLQTLRKGHWLNLPAGQRLLGGYILATPFAMALAWPLIPAAIVTAILLKVPVPVTLLSVMPTLPMLIMLLVGAVGLAEFCHAYHETASSRDYARLVIGLPFYQLVLSLAAIRALVRSASGARTWEKTAHLGLHLSGLEEPAELGDQTSRVPQPVAVGLGTRQAATAGAIGGAAWRAVPGPGTAGNGNGHASGLLAGRGDGPIWARLDGVPPPARSGQPPVGGLSWPKAGGLSRLTGHGLSWPKAGGLSRLTGHGLSWLKTGGLSKLRDCLKQIRPRLARLGRSDIAVQLPLVAGLGIVQWVNAVHWPAVLFDEGTYIGNAWAIVHRGELGFYTYTYGHPPLGWLMISIWTWAGSLFGHGAFTLAGARALMGVVAMVSFALLFTLARRVGLNRLFAAMAVIIFALSPLSLYFHRGVMLDNPATMWAIAAFVLALSPRRRLWSFAASGACFAASVLSKETTLVILPALILAAIQHADGRTRRYCMTVICCFFFLLGFLYPLYAILKGELLPGPGHVSLIGTDINMVATRQGTGSIFNPHSVGHGTVTFWLSLDPWLVGAALMFSPLALWLRRLRPIALAYLIQVAMVLRSGYLPAMYVIAFLPFAAIIVAGSMNALWRYATEAHPKRGSPAAGSRWRAIAARAMTAASQVAVIVAPLALAATAAIGTVYVAPRWAHADYAAMTLRLDRPELGAQAWLLRHVGRKQRIIVTDDFWVFLIAHGYDSQPVKGGFNSPTVMSYWPLDKDPAVRRFLPYGWRECSYIVSTPAMRDTAADVPNTAQALQHSHVVAAFGRGSQTQIAIRAITPTPLTSRPAGAVRSYRVPASGVAPSLRRVARKLGTTVDDILRYTNSYPDIPPWWYYVGAHHYDHRLPRGVVLRYPAR